MNKQKRRNILLITIVAELAIILAIRLSTLFSNTPILYYFFYNAVYGLTISTLLPLAWIWHTGDSLSSLGFKKMHTRQWVVVAVFVILSIGGQHIPLVISGAAVNYGLFLISAVPLLTSTFFEEFLFRGFFQTRLEARYGAVSAIFLSGMMFSLYHFGYPGFSNWQDLLLLFIVGIGFAVAFKLSGNNVIASYLVNLPNAYLIYMLKSTQFPIFSWMTSIASAIIIVVIIAVFIVFISRRCKTGMDH